MSQRLTDLDKAGDAGGGVKVPDIRLHRTDAAELLAIRGAAESLSERGDLDRVADGSTGAVRLDVLDRVRVDVGDRERFGDCLGLPVDTGRQIAGLVRTVVVDRGTLDHRVDMVTIGDGIRQPTQHHESGATAENGSARAVVE